MNMNFVVLLHDGNHISDFSSVIIVEYDYRFGVRNQFLDNIALDRILSLRAVFPKRLYSSINSIPIFYHKACRVYLLLELGIRSKDNVALNQATVRHTDNGLVIREEFLSI